MEFSHKTVLLNETVKVLDIKPDGVYVDGTAGGGGLSYEIASKLSDNGKLICIDQDPDAIEVCKKRLGSFKNVAVVKGNFSEMADIVHNLGYDFVDGVVLDIGVSSYQLDAADRGFSYNKEAVLDMRMSKSGESAYDVVNFCDYETLRNIIKDYGEEKFASKIANAIIKARCKSLIKTTTELAEIIKGAIPAFSRRSGGHPAKRTFQALRIYVNNELENLSLGLDGAFEILNSGGKLIVITFHSLEDKIVKSRMKTWSQGCTCPSDFPICVCGKKPLSKIVCKKAIKPSEKEVDANFRSRSAKLRACEKL